MIVMTINLVGARPRQRRARPRARKAVFRIVSDIPTAVNLSVSEVNLMSRAGRLALVVQLFFLGPCVSLLLESKGKGAWTQRSLSQPKRDPIHPK